MFKLLSLDLQGAIIAMRIFRRPLNDLVQDPVGGAAEMQCRLLVASQRVADLAAL